MALDARLDIRLPAHTKAVIERAALLRGQTVSQFIISIASKAAEQTLRSHQIWLETRQLEMAFVEAVRAA